ncbi:hypothetical protein FRC96_15275 [Lujinxingia vulgaris]|uniref:Uncharacterized protein n=1 Tax=Lujinxingia vulgaris TaxID=2600176 RepID=A0A5C6WWQ7_9DELT|nr:hypothetical protein [Lujinxingia vulgaris]TXD33827.1 hypothetical protein FRC96_15275 [Lujinxingia vulgaris]
MNTTAGRSPGLPLATLLTVVLGLGLMACDTNGQACESNVDCYVGEQCVLQTCLPQDEGDADSPAEDAGDVGDTDDVGDADDPRDTSDTEPPEDTGDADDADADADDQPPPTPSKSPLAKITPALASATTPSGVGAPTWAWPWASPQACNPPMFP